MASPAAGLLSERHYNNVYKLLVENFESSLQEADFTDLIKNVEDLYNSFTGQGFEESFKAVLMVVFSTTKRNVDVRRILCFISECAVKMDNKFKSTALKEASQEHDDMHPLLMNLFKVLTKWAEASDLTVRVRSCQLLYMILTYIQDHGLGEIDEATYERLSQVIEERILDVSCNVRAHAVMIAKFFQDPYTVNDPVIAGLNWQMLHDPNPRVRQNIVDIIAACEETIIPITKRFLYDKNPGVRNAALLHICNRISPLSFSTAHRILIFEHCFSDPSDLVRRNAEQRLIPVWFRAYKDKLCKFFKDLRIGSQTLDNLIFINELLRVLSKCVKIAHIVEEIDLDPETGLPKSTLSAERVFLWHHFYELAHNDQRLSKFFPQPEVLIDYLLKYFYDSSIEEDQTTIFNELIVFLKDVLETEKIESKEKVFLVMLNVMKNPFVSHEVMPYIISLYLSCSPKDKEIVHREILEVIEDLLRIMQFTDENQRHNILLKCFPIASELMIEEDLLSSSIRSIKDTLIIPHLNSEEPEIKIKAISTLALYCLLDIKEAKLSWSLFENSVQIDPSPMKNTLLKSTFDLLKCYGPDLFTDITESGEEKFNETVERIVSYMEDDESERNIVVHGTLKLFVDNRTWSPSLLSKIILLYFHPDKYSSTQYEIETFFSIYPETKNEAECLSKAMLCVIKELFDSDKNSPYHKVSIKKAYLSMMEFFKQSKNFKEFSSELENFQDSLVLNLTRKFIKKPWRLAASELYNICSSTIPKNFEKMLNLKENIKLIIEKLNSASFQRKNPFSKRSLKQFSGFMKKIQSAMDAAPLNEASSKSAPSPVEKRLVFSSFEEHDSSRNLQEAEITVDTSPVKDATLSSKKTNRDLSIASSKSAPSPVEKRLMFNSFEERDSSSNLQEVEITVDTSPVKDASLSSKKADADSSIASSKSAPSPVEKRLMFSSFEEHDSSSNLQEVEITVDTSPVQDTSL